MDFDYKKYSLENLEKWMSDALLSSKATPQEIYDVIKGVVEEEYHYFKHHTGRCYDLLALLNGNGKRITNKYEERLDSILEKKDKLTCDKDDPSEECKGAWNDFWEEHYYPEEAKDDGMRPWGHSDLEYGLANDLLSKYRISNFPGEQYSEEELNAMCEKATSDQEKEKCREYNLREAEYYDKRAQLDLGRNRTYDEMIADGYWMTDDGFWIPPETKDKVKKWVLPVEETKIAETDETEYFVSFPDDLLEAADLKEGDQVEWVDKGDGSYLLRKVTKPIGMEEC
jgi:hypothetical protein